MLVGGRIWFVAQAKAVIKLKCNEKVRRFIIREVDDELKMIREYEKTSENGAVWS